MEKLRFERIQEKAPAEDRLTVNDQRLLAARLDELKREPIHMTQELLGSSNVQRQLIRERTPLDRTSRPVVFSFGERVWRESEKYPHSIPLSTLLEDVRRKGSKERQQFISNRMDSLSGNDQERLINLVRSNINGLIAKRVEKLEGLVKNLSEEKQEFTTLFDFPGRIASRPVNSIPNSSKPMQNSPFKENNEKNGKPDVTSILGYPTKQTYARLMNLFKKVEDPSQSSLSFCMVGDSHRAIREYLRDSGWSEKFITPDDRLTIKRALQSPPSRENKDAARSFNEHPVKFIWANGYLNWTCLRPGVIVSRIPSSNAYFSKTSLSMSLRDLLPFIYEKGEVDAKIPRTYEIRAEGDMKHFSKQFRLNACICLLKKYSTEMNHDQRNIISFEGTVPLDCLDFAVKRVVELIRFNEHADLDEWNFSVVNDDEWDLFLARFYDIVHYDAKFQIKGSGLNVTKLQATCQKLLDHVYKYFPEMKYEGTRNLWICKPANGSCGRGVRVSRKLQDIISNCRANYSYVIQKYIVSVSRLFLLKLLKQTYLGEMTPERWKAESTCNVKGFLVKQLEMPLLIYNTKFDIRQWFVITSVSPLVIWMYNECYLRFCSQEFSLNNLHESIHLCNNTIQWKYKNGARSPKLPNDNMWDNYTFADFLRKELKNDQWLNIQEQMKQAIIAACVSTQEKMFHRPNSFHLYGADFMVTPDFQVWLIEINCQPAMKYSTSVTARMCKAVLEDTIKVGVERKLNQSAPVGKFREIYRQTNEPAQAIMPFGGITHSRKAKILPRKPYPFNSSGENSNRSNRRKWITYEESANYKRHSMISVKLTIKTDLPLDPGDATSASMNRTVVLKENVYSDIVNTDAEDEENTEENAHISECKTIEEEIKDGYESKTSDYPENASEYLGNVKNKAINTIKNKYINTQKNNSANVNLEKVPMVLIPLENKKRMNNTKAQQNSNESKAPLLDKMIRKDELLQNPKDLPKGAVLITKKALSYNKLSNVKSADAKTNVTSVPNIQRKQTKLTSIKNKNDMQLIDKNENRKSTTKAENNNETSIGDSKEVYCYEGSGCEDDAHVKEENEPDNTKSERNYCDDNEGEVANDSGKSQSSSYTDIMFDILEDEGKELFRELSGLAIIGESAADRKLEYILNSPAYLTAIGKCGQKADPTFKAIISRRRECCE